MIAALGDVHDTDLVFELIVSAVRLARDRANRGDMKIANAALKEMRYAFHVFEPYRAQRKVAIFGSARTQPDDPLYDQARQFARGIAEHDWMVITGAGPGIMEAGIEYFVLYFGSAENLDALREFAGDVLPRLP